MCPDLSSCTLGVWVMHGKVEKDKWSEVLPDGWEVAENVVKEFPPTDVARHDVIGEAGPFSDPATLLPGFCCFYASWLVEDTLCRERISFQWCIWR